MRSHIKVVSRAFSSLMIMAYICIIIVSVLNPRNPPLKEYAVILLIFASAFIFSLIIYSYRKNKIKKKKKEKKLFENLIIFEGKGSYTFTTTNTKLERN